MLKFDISAEVRINELNCPCGLWFQDFIVKPYTLVGKNTSVVRLQKKIQRKDKKGVKKQNSSKNL